ncbi:acyl-CoA synthetase [Streptomyces sp. TS71-3]|uniref:acyl-CoA synthetase n=1 Tax=Streptomyces sp. TS71-3 TaxID=2733862 RepID=UPI001B22756B|nr:acyl-CoA synthetase [Streptomyces sp. TS71-3]GHJ37831.1 acyl-CoA synthetase [Streptomyces sp. TS71-3]
MSALLPAVLSGATDRPALRFGDRSLTYGTLRANAADVAARLAGAERVAVWATPTLETAVAVVGALLAGVAVVPLNPRSGTGELGHILSDSEPSLLLAPPADPLPDVLADVPRTDVVVSTDEGDGADEGSADGGAADGGAALAGGAGPGGEPGAPVAPFPGEPADEGSESTAFVVYTSGTTGPPKGVLIPHRAVAATLDALAEAWQWTSDDVLVHGLPLFHVHGLILGVLGPLRRGGSVRHLGRFSTEGAARELADGATMMFGVPTMYHRVAEALPDDPALASALAGARLLVSGSAALPVHDHERITAATGRAVVERYGMTETLMNTSVLPGGEPRPGTVGVPLPGVELRLVDEAGAALGGPGGTSGQGPAGGTRAGNGPGAGEGPGSEEVGEIQVRGPNLFTGYLNRPDATADAFTADGWFRTGDMAVLDRDGAVRIVGRKATDLIKSGGFKIGAGEIENALLEHPGVREAAVTGEPDDDLGERVVAWVVPEDSAAPPTGSELADHVSARLAPHKRPRTVRYLEALPRNDMGKIMKRALGR